VSRPLALAFLAVAAVALPCGADEPDLASAVVAAARDETAPSLGLLGYDRLEEGASGVVPDDDTADEAMRAGWLRAWARRNDVPREALATALACVRTEVEVAAAHGSRRLAVESPPGRTRAASRTRELVVLADYRPELACDDSGGLRPSAAGVPVVRTLRDGVAVDVRASPVTGGRVAVEARVQWGAFDDPPERVSLGARYLGEMDLPRYRGGVARISGAVADGAALEATLRIGGEAVALRVVPRAEVPKGSERARRLDTSLGTLPPIEGDEVHGLPDVVVRSIPDTAIGGSPRRSFGDLDVHADDEAGLWVAGEPLAVAAAAALVEARAAAGARTVRVEVRAHAGDDEIARFTLSALDGRTALLRVGEDRAVVADAGSEVG
jgi:hypothetical protein